MARNPVTGAHYPWYRDAVWAENIGNGEIVNVLNRFHEIVVTFRWMEGTLANPEWKELTVHLDRDIFKGCWTGRYGGLWQLREQDVI